MLGCQPGSHDMLLREDLCASRSERQQQQHQ
jgi:hypothetical protein